MITFSKKIQRPGSSQITINVDRDGVPFGQIWTFKEKECTSPWHCKTLAGEYKTFRTEKLAKSWMSQQEKARCSMK